MIAHNLKCNPVILCIFTVLYSGAGRGKGKLFISGSLSLCVLILGKHIYFAVKQPDPIDTTQSRCGRGNKIHLVTLNKSSLFLLFQLVVTRAYFILM